MSQSSKYTIPTSELDGFEVFKFGLILDVLLSLPILIGAVIFDGVGANSGVLGAIFFPALAYLAIMLIIGFILLEMWLTMVFVLMLREFRKRHNPFNWESFKKKDPEPRHYGYNCP